MTSLTVPKTDYRRTYIKRPSGRRRSPAKDVGMSTLSNESGEDGWCVFADPS